MEAWSLPDLLGKMLSGVLASFLHRPAPVRLVPVTLADSLQPKRLAAPHSNISTLGHRHASLAVWEAPGDPGWPRLPCLPCRYNCSFLGQPCDLVSRHLAEFSKCSSGLCFLVTLFTPTPLGPWGKGAAVSVSCPALVRRTGCPICSPLEEVGDLASFVNL